ncbi:circumsporozoite protein-like [Rhinolophus ferrumequinum]|uniref:circumsporozoite protein-like n=1 Tax=Rhinolophus ferrumequinum TaxID=59479 RepID=UPI00140F5C62|nr:circumsporozoite protein-like [Rhinolophus ferrumequinum]
MGRREAAEVPAAAQAGKLDWDSSKRFRLPLSSQRNLSFRTSPQEESRVAEKAPRLASRAPGNRAGWDAGPGGHEGGRGEDVSPLGKAGKAAARPEAGRRAEPEKGLRRARVWPLAAVEEAGAQAGLAKCGAAGAHSSSNHAVSPLRSELGGARGATGEAQA